LARAVCSSVSLRKRFCHRSAKTENLR
jgi:hypothetical protein